MHRGSNPENWLIPLTFDPLRFAGHRVSLTGSLAGFYLRWSATPDLFMTGPMDEAMFPARCDARCPIVRPEVRRLSKKRSGPKRVEIAKPRA